MNQPKVLTFLFLETCQENKETPAEYLLFTKVTLSGSKSYLQLQRNIMTLLMDYDTFNIMTLLMDFKLA